MVFAAAFMIDPFQMIKVFCKPRIKVGTEWVTKGQTCDQVLTISDFIFLHDSISQATGGKASLWSELFRMVSTFFVIVASV